MEDTTNANKKKQEHQVKECKKVKEEGIYVEVKEINFMEEVHLG